MSLAQFLPRLKQPSVIPGFGVTLGFTLLAMGLIVIVPLVALVLKASSVGPVGFLEAATNPRVLGALRLSFGAAAIAALVDAVFGVLIAWILVRYNFLGRKFIDAAIDLPFALPTAVAGIALATLYAPNGWIGALAAKAGFKIAFTPFGIVLALIFIGLPFVVRSVEPVLAEAQRDVEEAAALLGASRWRTVRQIVLPAIYPALLTGTALAFARAVGEYGSVIFIAGNIPFVSEIAPLLIVIKLEEFDYVGATVIATLMLALSLLILLGVNKLQSRLEMRYAKD
ncbi:MAG: sulfate ABC transporter permease subunit CysT [Pseudomonadota bacterium]|nr:sulfate ABC transporter permease subunit CysT [Pseudomonadota bacterium]